MASHETLASHGLPWAVPLSLLACFLAVKWAYSYCFTQSESAVVRLEWHHWCERSQALFLHWRFLFYYLKTCSLLFFLDLWGFLLF